jgi:hypothetical protein
MTNTRRVRRDEKTCSEMKFGELRRCTIGRLGKEKVEIVFVQGLPVQGRGASRLYPFWVG